METIGTMKVYAPARLVPFIAAVGLSIVVMGFLGCSASKGPSRAKTAPELPATEREKVPVAPAPRDNDVPKRIILMIGDGMGTSAVTGAAYAAGEPLNMLSMRWTGYATTHEYEFVTTDSAASATALATGKKTHFEGVSVRPGTTTVQETDEAHHLETAIGAAKEVGWRTGLVATSRIVHATPAAFASHRANRKSYEAIAEDMVAYGVDVLLGGGARFFQNRADGRNLLSEMEAAGYAIALDGPSLRKVRSGADRLVGLLHEKDMPAVQTGEREASLAEMVETAVEVLDREDPEGFFLMVEGSQIDWKAHDLDGPGVVAETLDFDAAVGAALRYARGRDDTLVVVTADHETGGLDILDPLHAERFLRVLGGQDAATARVELPLVDGKHQSPAPPPVQHLAIGSGEARAVAAHEAGKARFALGPHEAADRRMTPVFGFLSTASRPLWRESGRFSATHTAVMVPIFAEGPGERYISAATDNSELGSRIKELVERHRTNGKPEQAVEWTSGKAADQEPYNVILMIGDGMGLAPITAASYVNGPLEMLSLPIKGMVATHGTDRLVNDSAATATALATGKRTRYGVVGMAVGPDGLIPAETVLERAEAQGIRTGLVTTTTLTHATPAAFYAHHHSRKDESTIARFFVDLPERVPGADGIDVAIGGGKKMFSSNDIARLRERGYLVESAWTDVPLDPQRQTLRFVSPRELPPAHERQSVTSPAPSLARMTQAALAALSQSETGFFLMVEGGQIDWALHGLDRGPALINEVVDFDAAVKVAKAFAQRDGRTLVIVTADHDHTLSVLDTHYGISKGQCGAATRCGGNFEMHTLPVAVERVHHNEGLIREDLQGRYAPPEVMLQYSWIAQAANERLRLSGPHSANFVPLFAFGPGAERLTGFLEQPQIGQLLLEWASASSRD